MATSEILLLGVKHLVEGTVATKDPLSLILLPWNHHLMCPGKSYWDPGILSRLHPKQSL